MDADRQIRRLAAQHRTLERQMQALTCRWLADAAGALLVDHPDVQQVTVPLRFARRYFPLVNETAVSGPLRRVR